MKYLRPTSDRSMTQTFFAAMVGFLLVVSFAAQGAGASETLLPLVDDGGFGGNDTRSLADVSGYHQSNRVTQSAQEGPDGAHEALYGKATLSVMRFGSNQLRTVFDPWKHADDEVHCFTCFSYR
jgi:hypothetical protein